MRYARNDAVGVVPHPGAEGSAPQVRPRPTAERAAASRRFPPFAPPRVPARALSRSCAAEAMAHGCGVRPSVRQCLVPSLQNRPSEGTVPRS